MEQHSGRGNREREGRRREGEESKMQMCLCRGDHGLDQKNYERADI